MWADFNNNKNFFFADYKELGELDIESYNLQIAEIDANAFAYIVMVDLFGVKPLFSGMSPKIISEILRYIERNYG